MCGCLQSSTEQEKRNNNDQPNDYIIYNPIKDEILSRHSVETSDMYPADWKLPMRPELIRDDSSITINVQPNRSIPIDQSIFPPTAQEDIVATGSVPNSTNENGVPNINSITDTTTSNTPTNSMLNPKIMLPSIQHLIPKPNFIG